MCSIRRFNDGVGQLLQKLLKLGSNCGVVLSTEQLLHPYHQIQADQALLLMPKNFAQYAAHKITIYRTARRFLSYD